MSLKWVFALGLVIYGFNVFSAEIHFNQLIDETYKDQLKLASEIKTQLGLAQQKTLKQTSDSKTLSLEGTTLQIFN